LEDADEFAKLQITGKPEQVETARRLIRESLETAEKLKHEKQSKRKQEASDSTPKDGEIVRVPRWAVGRVIGKQGKVLSGIRDRSGATLKIPQIDESKGEVPFYDFVVSGSTDAIEKAKTEIQGLVDKMERDRAENDSKDGSAQKVLNFPQGVAGAIIGLKGVKIAELRQEFGTKISVDCHPDHCDVTVSGTDAQQVERAVAAIQAIANEKQEMDANESKGDSKPKSDNKAKSAGVGQVFETFEIPAKAMGLVIGPKGANVAELRSRSGARITLEKNDESDRITATHCKVHVSGTAEQVRRARTMVLEAADGTPQREENLKVLKVPKSVVGKIIGKGGQTVQRIGRESGAQVKVSTDEDPCVIRINGLRKNVQEARRMIDEVVGIKGEQLIQDDEPRESREMEHWSDGAALDHQYSGFFGRPYSGAGSQPYSGAPMLGMLHGAKPYSGGAAFYSSGAMPGASQGSLAAEGIDMNDI